ncbi:glycoside hydrolase [Trichoderma cornu-damae]|uniref:Glycoside hydrolase n=1 Tax=Trichoderma cornu-damae TaxID=654480 RepID=A0A9P8QRG7_9HYPO|nr:glycoside hydrolase [Trichoderma cornu-damae]
MYKAVALTSIAALAGQTMAFNVNRHEHQMDKRVLKTDWCTVWETVYVTVQPGASTPAAVASPTKQAAPTVSAGHHPGGGAGYSAGAPTVTSTSIVVVPSTKATTLATSVRQSSIAPIKTSIVPVVSSSAAAPSSSSAAASSSSAAASSSAQAASTTAAAQSLTEKADPTPTPTPSSSSSSSSSATPSSQPPPPSTTSEAAPSSTPTQASEAPLTGSLFSSKRGMAYNDGNLANTFGAASGKMGWAYNWGFWPSGLDTSRYSYIPTLWGPAPVHSDGFDAQASALIASGSKAIFSFNEPDIASQANLSPAAAAASHAQFLNKYAGKALIGAPSVSNSGANLQGLSWLQAFVNACNSQAGGCAYDFCNVHWYSGAQYIDTLFTHLDNAHKICGGKPIFLTEFAPSGSDADISNFLKTALPKLDALDYLMGYSYFMVATGSLMSSTTTLSSYGQIYATA